MDVRRFTVVIWSLRRDRWEPICFSELPEKANGMAEQLRFCTDLSVRVVESVDDVDLAIEAVELLHGPNLTESEAYLATVSIFHNEE